MTALPLHPTVADRTVSPSRGRRSGLLRALLAGVGAVATPGAARREAIPAIPPRVAQALLVQLGHLEPDAITGRWDGRTVAAVARFQAAAGLPADGVASAVTADRLLIGPS